MLPDLFLRPAERDNAHTVIDEHHPEGVAWSEGNRVRPIVHGRPYMAELHERVSALGEGDLLYFVDWRGDPDQRLTDDPGSTVSATFAAAARRGADVRGLLWRSHWNKLGFHSEKSRLLGIEIDEAGGQCLRDMRVRTGGSHHQKFVVLRHRDDPSRDIAYLGGIDLCHSRRDDIAHEGDPQVIPMPQAFGPRPAWHDVHVAIEGRRCSTSRRPSASGGRTPRRSPSTRAWLLSSLAEREPLVPRPLAGSSPHRRPRPRRPRGADPAHLPVSCPRASDFAPRGSAASRTATPGPSPTPGGCLPAGPVPVVGGGRPALREGPAREPRAAADRGDPAVPDEDGALTLPPQLTGQAGDGPAARGRGRPGRGVRATRAGYPIYVHAKVCVIDDVWASVGSDNFNRRSWSSDSEIACAVQDVRVTDREAGAARLLRPAGASRAGGRAPRHRAAGRARRPGRGLGPDGGRGRRPGRVVRRRCRPRGRRHLPRPKAPMKGTSVRWRRRSGASTGAAAWSGRRAACAGCRRPS